MKKRSILHLTLREEGPYSESQIATRKTGIAKFTRSELLTNELYGV
jgi:hypothetical protein